jgi:hypothetical protein
VLELIARAGLALEVARRTASPKEPFAHAGNAALAAGLYREAVYWALLAHVELGASGEASETAPATSGDVAELFERVDRARLLGAAGSEVEVDALTRELAGGSFRGFADLRAREQGAAVARFARVAEALVEPLSAVERQVQRIRVRRVAHVLSVGVLLVVLLGFVRQYLHHLERQHDLAPHASWTTSSVHPLGACSSPVQNCAGGEDYFFHTKQQTDPWITFDLGKPCRFSALEVDNRLDCCAEQAVPLVVAVSMDGKRFRDVTRTDFEFISTRFDFEPVEARYVRLHVPKPDAILHLSRVGVYP